MQIDTICDIAFYHGTSSTSAVHLLTGESISWFFEDARALAGDIVSVLLRHRNHLYETADLFVNAGVENGISAPLGLSQLVECNVTSSFSYGQLWLTTSFKMASEYALRNRHGSEAFAFLMDGLKALDFSGEADGEALLRKYPRLQRLASMDHEPVVVSFRGFNCDDLRGAHGGAVSASDVITMLDDQPGVEYSPAYRLLKVEREKIAGVHDLIECFRESGRRTVPPFLQDLPGMEPREWVNARRPAASTS